MLEPRMKMNPLCTVDGHSVIMTVCMYPSYHQALLKLGTHT